MQLLKLALFMLLFGLLVSSVYVTVFFYITWYMTWGELPPIVPWVVAEALSWVLSIISMGLLWRSMEARDVT